jgi:mannose-6-phosphate isomerase-like protein (cupin superfamily)
MQKPPTFTYPGRDGDGGRVIREGGLSFHMCAEPKLKSKVLVLQPGVHNSIHAHPNEDAHYFVLAGRATFHATGDAVVAELGPNDGLFMPHAMPYWFESAGVEALEMLRVSTTSDDSAGV